MHRERLSAGTRALQMNVDCAFYPPNAQLSGSVDCHSSLLYCVCHKSCSTDRRPSTVAGRVNDAGIISVVCILEWQLCWMLSSQPLHCVMSAGALAPTLA